MKDGMVVILVGAQLQVVMLGDDERNFKNIDRVQTESIAIQRFVGLHIGRRDFEIQGGHHQFGDFKQQGCIGRRVGGLCARFGHR